MKVLMIDNFDSFTFNLVDDLEKLGAQVIVIRNKIKMKQILAIMANKSISHIVISPGPGQPEQAPEVIKMVKKLRGKIPILGICLGHQIIAIAEGGKVDKISELFHGKSCTINLHKSPLLKGISSPMRVARYHSLGVTKVPENMKIGAIYNDIPMMIENTKLKLFGLQFHPESILTPQGLQILQNFLLLK